MKHPQGTAIRVVALNIRQHGAGTTKEIAERVKMSYDRTRAALRRLRGMGLLMSERVRVRGDLIVSTRWIPAAALSYDLVTHTEATVRQRLSDGPVTTAELIALTGVTKQALWQILVRLRRAGVIYGKVEYRGHHTTARYALVPGVAMPGWLTLAAGTRRRPFPLSCPMAVRKAKPGTTHLALVDDDDDDWQPPVQYLSASRRYALGLPVAGRAA